MPDENQCTRIRVAALILKGDTILLAEHEKGGRRYWLLPGGGVEYGESIEEALKRELIEEAGLDIEVDQLLWIVDSIPEDHHRHVLNLILSAHPISDTLKPGSDRVLRTVAWHPLEGLMDMEIFPDTRQEILQFAQNGWRGSGILGKRWK
ncbi:MAG: NUDIX hydrolase [Candidatus Omnitrophica bacterium]|nr:MAG: RNA pyrophosphohydrolase [Candidatus Hinthialibacteria bacterium OLB16]MCK6495773.1 NUDIX hydrolase [bacterium]MCL4734349.1 NUDIX hydrolase [Candidatus Omnitrophota bacterium]NUP92234.1 NUDIX hydrolase [Candidatus Omnitrophota bacterium]